MRDILLLDCYEIGCPKVLMYVFTEMCEAFTQRNYHVKIIHSIDEITNNSIVYMGDSIRHADPCSLLRKIPDAIYIGWYWHNIDTSSLKYFIHTYENMLQPDKRVTFIQKNFIHCPLLLRASDKPDMIGKYERHNVHDYCYMGWKYCSDFVPSEPFKGIYHGVCDHNSFLSYAERKKIYLSSTFALGFQSNENIRNKHVSQRIFEGLAYGCIVLSNSIPACEQTNNIVVYVESKQDLENKMKFYNENPDIRKQKQEEGYMFIKTYGTNYYATDMFINCIYRSYTIII
jgi:hypothetical protein